MEFKHTPGPLYVTHAIDYGGSYEFQIVTDDDYVTAVCCDCVRGEHNAEANAKLYAESPNMLEILIECYDHPDIVGTDLQRRIEAIIARVAGVSIDEVII